VLNFRWGTGLEFTAANLEKVELVLHREEFEAWKRLTEPSHIFVMDMGDLFLEQMPENYIVECFIAMGEAPQHTYQLLTKRPERMLTFAETHPHLFTPNIWCGTSVELDLYKPRIDILRKVPCARRFLSCEPLLRGLGKLDLTGIHQVIVGAESGPDRRPFDPQWAREIRDQCLEQRVAFFFKQNSGLRPGTDPYLDGRKWEEFPA
jgi:protein gp37